LINLRLSYNRLTGTIPRTIQSHAWQVLDLSYNKLEGHLWSDLFDLSQEQQSPVRPNTSIIVINDNDDDDFQTNLHWNRFTNVQLYLDVNRLSGMIPSSIHDLNMISVLKWKYLLL
jgi:hypothetical protein